jgi:PadR family transcriptional regulator
MGPGPRMTIPTQQVLSAFPEDPHQELYGLEICHGADPPSGTVHLILARFEGLGWLESRWEDIDPRDEGRPQRRYYRLTGQGIILARDALARARRPVRPCRGARCLHADREPGRPGHSGTWRSPCTTLVQAGSPM